MITAIFSVSENSEVLKRKKITILHEIDYPKYPKFPDIQFWANSAEPDQTAPLLGAF